MEMNFGSSASDVRRGTCFSTSSLASSSNGRSCFTVLSSDAAAYSRTVRINDLIRLRNMFVHVYNEVHIVLFIRNFSHLRLYCTYVWVTVEWIKANHFWLRLRRNSFWILRALVAEPTRRNTCMSSFSRQFLVQYLRITNTPSLQQTQLFCYM